MLLATLMGASSSKGWKLTQMFSLSLCCCESAQVSSDGSLLGRHLLQDWMLVSSKACPDDQHLGSQLGQTLQEGECKGGVSQLLPFQKCTPQTQPGTTGAGVSLENIYSVWKLFKLSTSTVTLKKLHHHQEPGGAVCPW